MEYLTSCYRRQGEQGNSLLLQQYLCRQTPVCFACLCTCGGQRSREAARYITGLLLVWCRRFPWRKAVDRPDSWLERARKGLEREITRGETELRISGLLPEKQGTELTAILCIGEEILVLGRGQCVYLLNTAFGKGGAKYLEGTFRGRIEPNVGILIATEAFGGQLTERALGEALRPEELDTQAQADRHLAELGRTGGKEDHRNSAAVLLLAKRQ